MTVPLLPNTGKVKNRPLVAKKHKQISINLNLTQPHQNTMEVFTSYNHFKTFTSHTGFRETVKQLDDSEKH